MQSPADRGHFDHFNEEPNEERNEEPKQESNEELNEEPKHEPIKQPIKEPKLEPNEETVVEVGVLELGSDANEETVVEVPDNCKTRRTKKRGIACKSPYTVVFNLVHNK